MTIFKLSEIEQMALSSWIVAHRCKYYDDGSSVSSPQGAIGGVFTYQFTPTNLGCVVKVKCACGEEKDLTNYSDW